MQQLNVDFKEANFLRDYYWKKYGTTLAGMMREHDIDPLPYLIDVHDISLSSLDVDLSLVKTIKNLSGEKIVYTNGSKFHANRVLKARGLTECFHKIFGVEDADYLPKPEKKAYQKMDIRHAPEAPKGRSGGVESPRWSEYILYMFLVHIYTHTYIYIYICIRKVVFFLQVQRNTHSYVT